MVVNTTTNKIYVVAAGLHVIDALVKGDTVKIIATANPNELFVSSHGAGVLRVTLS